MAQDKNDILNENELLSRLEGVIEVLYYPSLDSTNTEAKRLISSGKSNAFLITANEQTNGRGRQGKSFYSPASEGIYMSLASSVNKSFENAVGVTTAAAVAVCRAIESLTDKKPEIKWVNDIYLNGKKICGILSEAVTDYKTQRPSFVIIGIGLNVKTASFPSEIENAGCLGADIRRADLICEITKELLGVINSPYSSFIPYYKSRSMLIGKKINIIKNNSVIPATAVDIDCTGGLVVKTNDGKIQTLKSGEISIREA